MTQYVEGSSIVAYSSTNSFGSVIEASSTAYSPISSPSVVAYTSIGSDGSVTVGSTTSYGGIASASYVYNTINMAGSVSVATSTTSVPLMSNSPGSGSSGSDTISSSLFGSGPSYSLTDLESISSSIGSSTASNTSSATSIPGSSIVPEPGNTVTTSGTGTVASGVYMGAPAISANGGNGGASSTANGGNSIVTGTAGSGDNGGNDGAATSTATTDSGADSANNGGSGPESTATTTPSCAKSSNYAGNNTKYNDYFGYTYDIRCNLDIQATPTDYDAHAESFEDCLEYCSLLTDCVAVNYEDPPSAATNSSNCYPKWSFDGYNTSVSVGVYSGVNVNGASPGTLEDQNLCTSDNEQGTSYDGLTYYDDFGTAWTVGCDATLAIADAAALYSTVTDTLASCVDYCSTYNTCDMVNWTGPHTNGTRNDPNCFPASSIGTAGAAGSAPGSGFATLYS